MGRSTLGNPPDSPEGVGSWACFAVLGPVLITLGLAAIVTGVVLCGFGVTRMGRAIRYVPYPVVGGFLGAYLCGIALAQYGNYQWMWYADMALAAAAAVVNLPIHEARIVEPVAGAA